MCQGRSPHYADRNVIVVLEYFFSSIVYFFITSSFSKVCDTNVLSLMLVITGPTPLFPVGPVFCNYRYKLRIVDDTLYSIIVYHIHYSMAVSVASELNSLSGFPNMYCGESLALWILPV